LTSKSTTLDDLVSVQMMRLSELYHGHLETDKPVLPAAKMLPSAHGLYAFRRYKTHADIRGGSVMSGSSDNCRMVSTGDF